MSFKNPYDVIKKTTEKTMAIIEARGHVFIEGSYQNRESTLLVWCPIHANECSTTFYNYNRARTGCPCCGKEQVSLKLTNRKYSKETLAKMQIAANLRPYRGGKPRRWRETNNYRNWRKSVLIEYSNQCAVTGIKGEHPGDLEVHHLYCAKENQELIYVTENGILLEKSVHTDFHLKYGYGGNTLDQFQEFLLDFLNIQQTKNMLISSQANPQGLEGSETRVYDPQNRVMELHEHLERVKAILNP